VKRRATTGNLESFLKNGSSRGSDLALCNIKFDDGSYEFRIDPSKLTKATPRITVSLDAHKA